MCPHKLEIQNVIEHNERGNGLSDCYAGKHMSAVTTSDVKGLLCRMGQ